MNKSWDDRLQEFDSHKYMIYTKPGDGGEDIYSLVLVDWVLGDILEKLARHLNSKLKCEGAVLYPLSTERGDFIMVNGMYLCLYEQRWG